MMKRVPVSSLLTSLLLGVSPSLSHAQSWSVVWADRFDSGSTAVGAGGNWTYDLGGNGWGNNELQCYRSALSNVWKSNGTLKIRALREAGCEGRSFTSARLKTQGIRSFGPGDSYPVKLSARLRGPNGQGLWPAVWMLGTNIGSVGWPACGEIDIMEHVNTAGNTWGTIHWNGPSGYASYTGATPAVSFTAWNWYGVTWDRNQITWRVNGAQVGAANIQNNINSTEEFHRPFFLIMNLAVGGNWPGPPAASTVFPAVLEVDAVEYSRG
jgi:beta-glucanase (GH16 family)